MDIYFAPMEGITGHLFRNAHSLYYGGITKYFSPFISPTQNRDFSYRELTDILPENNKNIVCVPQILANNSELFLRVAEKLKEFGYEEVNLNLGCPSGTVVSKGKGAGFLDEPVKLKHFLDEIFEKCPMDISIKTRIGMSDPEEFEPLMELFNQYSMKELIIHPRVRDDYYKNEPNMQAFLYGLEHSKNPVCYNGNIFSVSEYTLLLEHCPSLERIMIGRGLLRNPGLITELLSNKIEDNEKLLQFHHQLYTDYQQLKLGEKNTLFKMKELWSYLQYHFPGKEKTFKKIRKAERFVNYESAVKEMFEA